MVAAVAMTLFRGYIPWSGTPENVGLAPFVPEHPVSPSFSPIVQDNVTIANMTMLDFDAVGLPGYTLYDSFNSEKPNVWIKSEYKPQSTFIDTQFLPSNVGFSNGDLVLRSDVDQRQGAEYKTIQQFQYGKYRTSMRVDQTPGTYMAFFVYNPDPSNHNEIDIELYESGGVTRARLTTWVDMQKNEKTFALDFDPSKDYHTYGFDWHPDRVDFYIDDVTTPIWTSTDKVPQGSCYLYFNTWVVTNPPADHGDGINTMYVDWVGVQPL